MWKTGVSHLFHFLGTALLSDPYVPEEVNLIYEDNDNIIYEDGDNVITDV
jgi:hypothetical protein